LKFLAKNWNFWQQILVKNFFFQKWTSNYTSSIPFCIRKNKFCLIYRINEPWALNSKTLNSVLNNLPSVTGASFKPGNMTGLVSHFINIPGGKIIRDYVTSVGIPEFQGFEKWIRKSDQISIWRKRFFCWF